MGFFRRKDKELAPVTPVQGEVLEASVERLYPAVEGERLYGTVQRLDNVQRGFLADCKERGMSAQDATSAMHDAMAANAYPTALALKQKRNMGRDLYLLHGTVPEGVVVVAENSLGELLVSLGHAPDDTEWPTEPNPDDPDAFFVEHHRVVSPGEVPTYGDPAIDIPAAQKYKDVNDRLSGILDQ